MSDPSGVPDRTVTVRVRATGRVQGVFFRASTRDVARRHGVTGWVRNDPDGAVTAVFEGPQGAVRSIVDWVRAGGPPQAVVGRVDVEELAAEGHQDFVIRR